MKQEDKLDFVAAMEKEMEDHESRGHWHIINRSTLPENAKPIKAICFFQQKRQPAGSIKQGYVLMVVCKHGGTITGKLIHQLST